jgi:hypothetical protein
MYISHRLNMILSNALSLYLKEITPSCCNFNTSIFKSCKFSNKLSDYLFHSLLDLFKLDIFPSKHHILTISIVTNNHISDVAYKPFLVIFICVNFS